MSLKDKVIGVVLGISQWTARKHDKKVTQKVEKLYAAHDAGRYNKMLIEPDSLKNIQKIAGEARTFHYANTLPWGDSGERILPAKNLFTYTQEMAKLKLEFERELREFAKIYPSLIENAKSRLNSMFNESEYPPISEIKNKFSFKTTMMPIGDVSDIRLEVGEDELAELKESVQNTLNERIKASTEDMMRRAQENIAHMVEKLTEKKKKGKEAIFRDSLVDNIKDLIELFPRLNFTNDQKITKLCEDMKGLLVDPYNLRSDKKAKKAVVEKAEKIMSQYF